MSNNRHLNTQVSFLILSSILAQISSEQQTKIHLSLIHRDSSLSPLYNPRDSPYERIRQSFVRSKARLSYLINNANDNMSGVDFQGSMEGNDGEYFVKICIGTPRVELLASVDTASELVLTRGYNRKQSSTYNPIPCNSSICTLVPNNSCDSFNMCSFSSVYADFPLAYSLLGSDNFTLETSDERFFALQDIIFGIENDDNVDENELNSTSPTQYDGILGLGYHNLSLVMQMSSIIEPKFTYCFGNTSDPDAKNQLVLGKGVFLEGQTTSLKVIEGRYNLVLEGLSIGKRRLDIPPDVFQVSESGGQGVIIESATTLTFLAPAAYYKLVEELEQDIGLVSELWLDPPFERCYKGNVMDIQEFRGLIFHFERDVNVVMDVSNLFLQVGNEMFCLAVLPSPVEGVSVLGSLFQQYYSVGYDLGEMLVSFQRIECEVLESHFRN
ncbi:aspartic proteinase CDR1-like [Amaranthus tricolor]|uniref:aspartic proteinase CDR1-like n=1 Tax=Amaranthus tricolor TaxID=29722 RepID=UPI00258BEF99|nr:aspartic proteinase CDR1-like [Amaranthus tricolor]